MTTAADRTSIPGLGDAAAAALDGYSVDMQRYDVDFDMAFAYQGLPNDQCQASHVGYVIKGKFTVRMADGSEEVFEEGDAVVIPPGHVPAVAAGTEFVMFTPIEEANAQAEVVQANMMKYAKEHGIGVPAQDE
jgi:hypothetical protein